MQQRDRRVAALLAMTNWVRVSNPNALAWGETLAPYAVPRWGIESADDKDVFRFEMADVGTYRIGMVDGPTDVGLWAIWYGNGVGDYLSYESPVAYFVSDFSPGTHYIGVGTPYQSAGNTGDYTLSLTRSEDTATATQP